MTRIAQCALPLLATMLWMAPAADAGLPPENQCPTLGGAISDGPAVDAVPRRLREGMRISYDSLLALRELLPQEIWSNRRIFFYPGMRMVIGPCHRRYPEPAFYRKATEDFAGEVSLDRKGNLEGYVAGTPFPPEAIDLEAPDAGIKWAWNLEYRFRGSGPFGSFRIVDVAGRTGSDLTYLGEFFFIQTRHRADLPASDHTVPQAKNNLFVAGGRFLEPTDARHLAWRQLRPPSAQNRYSVSDETFVYVPTMRKVRRAATAWVDGMYVPRYRVAGDAGGGSLPVGGGEFSGPTGSVSPTSAQSVHQTEHLPRGFTMISLRPNAYVWRVRAEREILAPLNSAIPGYPIDKRRNYGPHGLSVASDRWDVRWALVLEGKPRNESEPFNGITIYLDYQTRQPLYVVTKGSRGRILDVGISVHRYSEDTLNYPEWNNGDAAQVFDPVAEVFYHLPDDSGWRRESFDVRSTPAPERLLREALTTDFLMRRGR